MPFKKLKEVDPRTKKTCDSTQHNPPKHIVLEAGAWQWECPDCHAKQTIIQRSYKNMCGNIANIKEG